MRVQILPQEGKSCCGQTCASPEWTLTSPWGRRRDRENGVNGVLARNPRFSQRHEAAAGGLKTQRS